MHISMAEPDNIETAGILNNTVLNINISIFFLIETLHLPVIF